ncbi:Kae1-associated serine/threonine protein kinase [Candidatus Micrarchaeota archaeon]|nr:Kae1-associated serine/threonine protein kinase [Candidatus Micrarchaeota archaeon]
MKGAEAILEKITISSTSAVVKKRIPKTYRTKKLDEKLRRERTKSEARLLHKVKLAGINCPEVLEVKEFDIVLSYVDGKRPSMDKKQCEDAGKLAAKIHSADIIHGDYTPANLIVTEQGKLFVIDFGLGFVSNDVEDKAMDVFTMVKALSKKEQKHAFLLAYQKNSDIAKEIMNRLEKIEKRVRYSN